MRLSVESDGDRFPKDVYLIDETGGRVATIEAIGFCGEEQKMFKFARKLRDAFNAIETMKGQDE